MRRLTKKNGLSVRALRRETSKTQLLDAIENQIEWTSGGLDDIESLRQLIQGADTVIHAAALISMDDADGQHMHHINVNGTANVVDICLEKGIKRLIHVSSVAALGRPINSGQIDESSNWKTNRLTSAYAKSKRKAELEAWRGRAEGLEVSVIRPSFILGSGYWEDGTGSLLKTCADELPFYPAGGTGVVDVRDVADLIIRLIDSPEDGFDIIANGHNPSFRELQLEICTLMNVKPPKYELSTFLSEIGWRFEKVKSWVSGTKSVLTKSSVRRAMHHFYYDNSKSKESLDFEYRELSSTLRAVVHLYREFQKDGIPRLMDN